MPKTAEFCLAEYVSAKQNCIFSLLGANNQMHRMHQLKLSAHFKLANGISKAKFIIDWISKTKVF